jgi:hypothetical protein
MASVHRHYEDAAAWATVRGVRRTLLVVLLATAAAGCPSDPPPACITVDTSCAPGYQPTFTNVYNNTIKTGCGPLNSSCHSAQGRAGGLSFQDQATAHAELLQNGRVVPGDPNCSEMIVRTSSPGEDYQMPPGDPLTEPARCALIQWVLQGAQP